MVMPVLSENEIRPKALLDEQLQRYLNDVARLMRHQADFVTVHCPACESNQALPAFEKYGLSFVNCQNCRTLYANPRPRQAHLDEYYQKSENYAYWNDYIFPASAEVRREKIFKPRVERVLEICRRYNLPTNTLLEVGAGYGLFCEEMQKTGVFKRVIAVEPTPNLAATCRSLGLTTLEKPVEQIDPGEVVTGTEKIDVIANFEVIEHLFSPRHFLEKCASLLEAGGILILTCPNGLGFDVQTLGVLSCAVDTEHINLFNPDSLARLMEQCGFEMLDVQTPGLLDAELVRNKVLDGLFSLEDQPFLKNILIDDWENRGAAFQRFLIEQQLSSNMMLTARKK
jgi:2-polyprenyl-3-methyl-5-hydroxy-6-metoxy-1,4-benzoquinol methylase